jgi:hypothetical protein
MKAILSLHALKQIRMIAALGVPFVLNFTPAAQAGADTADFNRIAWNNPGMTVDLGVGLWAWPIPYDVNTDGLPDLLISSGGLPGRGIYYFENTGRDDPQTGTDVFRPGIRLSDGANDVTGSILPDGSLRVLTPGFEHPGFHETGLQNKVPLPVKTEAIHNASGRIRGVQGSYVDFNGDGRQDLVVGIGDWTDYGWDNAYDSNGRWANGPIHGYVFILINTGTNKEPVYADPVRLEADDRPVDVYGTPSPVFADFRGTGKLDLICGEFVDGLTFFANKGTREQPVYETGRRLRYGGEILSMPLCMIVVSAYDWNGDGRPDLVVGQEDGRVALMENTGRVVEGQPEFLPPKFFLQEANKVKFGVLTAPVSVDWDGDGLDDLLSGNSAGEVAFIKNLGGQPPRWDKPQLLEAGGKPYRIMAGYNGSIQGPAESKWGYANISVGDWNSDGFPDILLNSITGRILVLENNGDRTNPGFAEPRPLQVAWPTSTPKPVWVWWDPEPGQLVTQWRSTPYMIDLDQDGIQDLVTLDTEGYLAFYRQVESGGQRILLPGERIFHATGPSVFNYKNMAMNEKPGLLRLSDGYAGRSGRRTFCFTDWDGDGRLDLLVNSTNISLLRNVSTSPGEWLFEDMGPVGERILAGHSTAPTVVDWNGDGIPDLLAGAEDGFLYYLENPRTGSPMPAGD